MASNYYDERMKRFEEENKKHSDILPDDWQVRMPDAAMQELLSNLGGGVGEDQPEIAPDAIPEPILDASPIGSSSFDVDVSNTTPKMEGRPETLDLGSLSESAAIPKQQWELEGDIDPAQDLAQDPTLPVNTPGGPTDLSTDTKATEDALALKSSTDNDKAAREAGLAELERQRKFNVIPQAVAGAGDAISAAASAFGGNAPGGSRQRMIERQDKEFAQGKKDIETGLKDDAESDVSKQYQNLLAQMMQKDPSDTAILGLTANQIKEKIPAIETMMQRRSDEDTKRLAATAKQTGAEYSPAEKKFDQVMAAQVAEFAKGGGIKVALAAVEKLKTNVKDFKTLKPGFFSRIGAKLPFRGILQEKYMAIEQDVRSNVTDLLRATLGAQFTEKEGERIFSQTFDPTLKMETNITRMEALQQKLLTIAQERARATEWYARNQTFKGYQPQSNPNWTKQDDADLLAIKDPEDTARTTKSGYKYTKEPQ